MLDRPDRLKASKRVPRLADFASHASLVHVTDEGPGISRRRSGKGFSYRTADGDLVRDSETLSRIQALVIPPAWTSVWISPTADGHIQATGRDLRGRKQYRYHTNWSQSRDEVKFSSLVEFAAALPALRATIESDLRRPGMPREKVLASIVWLLDNTMIRVGNAAYARDNKSFGLTTLRDRHVKVEGATLRFNFMGKSGKEWRIRLVDRRMAKIIRTVQDLPGQQLFQYVDDEGVRRAIRSQDVNQYIREASGAPFSSKHFRTWGGTIGAAAIFSQTPVPETKTHRARQLNEVIDQVASRLGNTRTVCRKCYIHPRVMERWEGGSLPTELESLRRRLRKQVDGLSDEETLVWRWLQRD